MVPYTQFISQAPENITLFHFVALEDNKTGIFLTLDATDPKILQRELANLKTDKLLNNINCPSSELGKLNKLSASIEKELTSERLRLNQIHTKFRVNQVVCLEPKKVYRSDVLQLFVTDPTTIIFSDWRGCGLKECYYTTDKPTDVTVPRWTSAFRYGIITQTVFSLKGILKNQYQLHHSSIDQNAQLYLKHLGYNSSFISIHIRAERLVQLSKDKNDESLIKNCLNALSTVIEKLKQEINNTLFVSDIGPYGTSTCNSKKCKLSETQKVLARVNKLVLFQQFYVPRILNSSDNTAYVSLVEMHMLAMGEKLVLVGFGGFQDILKELFISKGHSLDNVIHACN